MRTVATLQQPTAGSIRFSDIDVLADPDRLRRTLGYLPQDFGVYPRVSAYAMLDQLAVLKGITGAGTANRRRDPARADQPLVRPQQVDRRLLRRYAAALRDRPGADRQP